MKFKIKLLILISLQSPFISVQSSDWSRFIKTQNRDDVLISFRQKKSFNKWLVEWRVTNNSTDTIEPFLVSRKYSCLDGSTINLKKQSLGVYMPMTFRNGGLKDKNICPNSQIKLVEIETVIREISQ